jgi:hypothetical protein
VAVSRQCVESGSICCDACRASRGASTNNMSAAVNTVPQSAARRSGCRNVFRARAATHAARISARRLRVYRGTAPVIVSTMRSR